MTTRNAKPGAVRTTFRPDIIETYPVSGDNGDTPQQLLAYLIAVMPQRKRTVIKNYLKHSQVMVNGNVTTAFDMPLAPGDDVRVNISRQWQIFNHPRLKIMYEDDDVIVVSKGYGLLSVGTDRVREGTVYSILRDYVKSKDPRNKIFIVHRLDQHTSGVMMLAKTLQAKEAMQHNWNNMVLERKYIAVVEGRPDPAEGSVESYLAENDAMKVYSVKNPDEGKHAVTYYTTLRTRGGYSLVELSLATGRKNQIRVHMADIGTPVAGDRRYGARTSPIHRLALHARTLRFVHPVTRRDMNFSTDIPASFRKLV